MATCIVLKEYEIFSSVEHGGKLPVVCYQWLKKIALERQEDNNAEFLRLISRDGKESLQVRNYVGLLQTPDGTCIEILPKISEGKEDRNDSIKLLFKMLQKVHELPAIETTDASLDIQNSPLIEVLIGRFLKLVANLVHKGIRSDYIRVQEQQNFMKGRLRVAQQIRQPVSKQHRFCIEYDRFSPDRPENRLIRSALEQVLKWSQNPNNQKLARELQFSFIDIEPSCQHRVDLSRWSQQRDMIYYKPLKPWVELILMTQTPWFMNNKWQGLSLLFPMEKLFEAYVGKILAEKLTRPYTIAEQVSSHYLTQHKGNNWFQLRPDFAIYNSGHIESILDTKWKLLNDSLSDSRSKYELSQSDFYQLYAYGQKYLSGQGNLFLIYPMHKKFKEPLAEFSFEENLSLWVVPFDLKNDELLLPEQFQSLFSANSLLKDRVA
ncbi:McrC family protein [sulfur-oxidizing endosymbiont of Gigantopelta aegis]|uniref:McrC family protein n=1 Tax=sulfur-oxidizing endosymbiont of Gigantopelta aegis TaxID=2794934 RepID=UPI0018DC6962|nr:McrC family protein [sulfur-oxidizing endosymbiont of Gigantopelta aegis]